MWIVTKMCLKTLMTKGMETGEMNGVSEGVEAEGTSEGFSHVVKFGLDGK